MTDGLNLTVNGRHCHGRIEQPLGKAHFRPADRLRWVAGTRRKRGMRGQPCESD